MERELEKLIRAAFNWYDEESKHTKKVNNEIAAAVFINSNVTKELINKIQKKVKPEFEFNELVEVTDSDEPKTFVKRRLVTTLPNGGCLTFEGTPRIDIDDVVFTIYRWGIIRKIK